MSYTIIELNNTFEDKNLTFSDWVDSKKCGAAVKNPRMSIGHKSMKTPTSPIPPNGKNYRDDTSFLYLKISNAPSIGIYHSYEYKQGLKVERIPANMKGYDLVIPLINDRERTVPNESDELYQALTRFHARVVKNICRNRDSLPDFAQKMSDEKLAECIYPIYGRPPKDSTKPWKPMLNVPFKYYKADPAKKKQESLQTRCNRPGGTFHPEEMLSVKGKCRPGTVDAIIRMCHLGYSIKVEGGKTKLAISYSFELRDLNFTPSKDSGGMGLLQPLPADDGAEDDLYGGKPVQKDVEDDFGDDAEPAEEPVEEPPKRDKKKRRD